MAPRMMTVRGNPNVSGWNLETGYSRETDHRKYPNNTDGAGPKNGLDLILSISEADHDFMSNNHVLRGFYITASLPGEETIGSQPYHHLDLSEDYQIMIESVTSYTSDGLRRYKPDQRQCYFISERRLRFFKTYTHINCIFECSVNFTKQQCGCVSFSMPSMTPYI